MYLEKEFIPSHEMTIGVEFGSKDLVIRNTKIKVRVSSPPPRTPSRHTPPQFHWPCSPLSSQRYDAPFARRPRLQLEIWDTAGQETYLSITRTYYRNTNACLLVYDITRRESFNHIVTWLEEARQNSNNPNLAVMVVGNKADLTSR